LAHQLAGTRPALQDFLAVVDVVEEGVQRLDPLLDALRSAGAIPRRR
jgi:hypothetical protein